MKTYDHWLHGALIALSFGLSACGGDMGAGEPFAEDELDPIGEEVAAAKQAAKLYRTCRRSLTYTNGTWTWRTLPAISESGCTSEYVSATGFGVASDIPLMGTRMVTYGTQGGRLGYFYVDMNGNRQWDSGDRGLRFRSDAQAGDLPTLVYRKVRQRQGNSCVDGNYDHVIAIKRGNTWFIDANNDGVWDFNNCDLYAQFGGAEDRPTSAALRMASTKATSGGGRQWWIDQDMSYSWHSATDRIIDFGLSTDHVPLNTYYCGVQRGRTVFVDLSCNGWTGAANDDYTFTNHLPSGTQLVTISYQLEEY